MKLEGFCFDAEADNLYLQAKKIWYIKFKDMNSEKELRVYPFKESYEEVQVKIIDWLESYPDDCIVSGWNILGYDLWLLWKLLGIEPRCGKEGKDWWAGKPVQFIDGFVLSMYLNPNQPRHSLEYVSGGEENADGKIDYRNSLIRARAMPEDAPKGYEFSFWHPLMEPYCDRDVDASIKAIKKLWRQAEERYGEANWLHKSFRQMQKDFWLYSAQAYTGIKFHKERAEALQKHIQERMKVIKDEVDPLLPKRPLKTAEQPFYKQPSKPFNKDGSYSGNLIKWLEKHNATLEDGIIKAYGLEVPLESNAILPVKLPMEIEDSQELKDYFLENGWVPSDDYWNFQKGPDGKNLKDANNKFIKTTPKINHAGQLCPNLLKLDGEIPAKVVKFLSLRNRLGVVTGWLNNWRIEFDGRLSAEISGYAPTSRVKHRVVVNCPKADPKVLLGAEMRDLFVVEDGYWYVGADCAALENRTLSSYTYKYDGGAFARLQTESDPHSFNAFAFFPHLHKEFDINNPENKEDPKFKSWRNKAKTGAYLLAFGGGAPKLASSLGLSKEAGKKAFDNYWEQNKGLGLLKQSVEKYFETTGNKKFIPAIDGRIVSVRGKNVLLSCLGQGCGAIAMSYAACLMDTWLGDFYLDEVGRPYYMVDGKVVKRVSMVHDEYSWEVEDGVQDKIKELTVKAMIKAGEILKLALPLNGEAKAAFEGSWKDVH
jgi:hypothetical protein